MTIEYVRLFFACENSTRCDTAIEVSSQRQRGVERVLEEVVDLKRESTIFMVEMKNSINNAKNATYVLLMLIYCAFICDLFLLE